MPTAKKNVINANIILYGPKNAGKSTNLQYIFRKVKQNQRGQIVPMTQEGYPHVSYEFLPMELGELNGYDTNLYIYTAPAHVDGSETRHNLLNEAAGVVFIVDSSLERLDDNIEALTMLKEELRFWDIDYDSFPIVFQYNHRDAPDALPIDDLETQLNPEGKPYYESEAATGDGVRDTFARICKMAVKKVRSKLVFEELESGKSSSKASSGLSVEPPNLTQRSASSEHTLNEAPPMRLAEYVESNQTGDELVVDDSDRPSDQNSKVDAITDAGLRRPVTAAPDSSASVSSRPSVTSDDPRRTSGTSTTDKSSSDAVDDDRSGGDDFLKTSMLFGGDSAPEDMGMMEAGEAEVVEGAAEEDEPEDDETPAPASRPTHVSEQLGTISLHESAPISAALNLSSLVGSDELNIQTVTEDEDEDDFQPVIMLGARARAAEEAEIEDEMMLDEEPLLEDESAPHTHASAEAAADEEASADEDVSAGEEHSPATTDTAAQAGGPDVEDLSDDEAVFQQTTVEQPLAEADVSPLTDTTSIQSSTDDSAAEAVFSSVEDESETESERSIIASDADLLAAGFSQAEARQILSSRVPEGLSTGLDVPITHVVEDEEEVFESHRMMVEVDQDLITPSEVQATPSGAVEKTRSHEEAPESQALPDLAIAPLEDEAIGSPEELGMVQELSATEASSDVFELVADQATPEESPFEMLHEGSIFESGHEEAGIAEKAAVTEALSETLFATAQSPAVEPQAAIHEGSDLAGLQLTRWGDISRVDERTLRLPVTVSLPGVEQPVELAITLRIDQLLETLLKR